MIEGILAMIPLILAVVLVVAIARKAIIEKSPADGVIAAAIPVIIVLFVAILIISPMLNTASPYSFDEGSGELTIKNNMAFSDGRPWDGYADDVTSLVIEEGVISVPAGAFQSLTSLTYMNLPETVRTVGANAFGVSLEDPYGSATTSAGEYTGLGEGVVYLCDPTIFAYGNESDGTKITGFASGVSGVKTIVVPSRTGDSPVTRIDTTAFKENTEIVMVLTLPDTSLNTYGYNCFQACTALTYASFPSTMAAIQSNAFNNCSSLDHVNLPGGLTAVMGNVFTGCTGTTEVSFASGFAPVSLGTNSFSSWNFKEADGTTAVDRTSAAALAGHTFIGTAAALVMQS